MKTITYIFLFIGTLCVHAQKMDRANALYEQNNYVKALKIYQKLAESEHASTEVYRRLGNIHYFKGDYADAEKWYSRLNEEEGIDDPEHLLRYAQALKTVDKHEEAERTYDQFLEIIGGQGSRFASLDDYYRAIEEKGLSIVSLPLNEEGTDDSEQLQRYAEAIKAVEAEQGSAFTSSEDYYKIIAENGDRYEISELAVNSEGIDYGSFVQDDKLYFSSSRSVGRKKIIDGWSGKPFLDIYTVGYDGENGIMGEPRALKGKVNTKFHESSPIITKDGKTLYFTRSNTTPHAKTKRKGNSNLKIYRATKIDGKWKEVEDLNINGEGYSNAHPVLGPNEKVLYFVSDMPGSMGGTDIYSVAIDPNGTLSKPINLGPKVNTRGRESFPFVTDRHELYFSSDGHFGLGGYDVFHIDLKKDDGQLVNVGTPINGPYDDYAFTLDNATKRGIFSSNRSGTDNIYGLLETKPIEDLFHTRIQGIVTDNNTGEPIGGAKVLLIGIGEEVLLTANTNDNGEYTLKADKHRAFKVKVEKRDYRTTGRFFKRIVASGDTDFQLDKNRIELAALLDFKNIYFDYNSSYLRKEAKGILDTIAQALMAIPNLKQIEVNSHADSRGTKKYNIWLSERRAKRVVDYLVGKGIDPKRIQGVAHGEERLVNDCSDNVHCPENSHQLNRRTEFIIK